VKSGDDSARGGVNFEEGGSRRSPVRGSTESSGPRPTFPKTAPPVGHSIKALTFGKSLVEARGIGGRELAKHVVLYLFRFVAFLKVTLEW
jgi:hypothetical protein